MANRSSHVAAAMIAAYNARDLDTTVILGAIGIVFGECDR